MTISPILPALMAVPFLFIGGARAAQAQDGPTKSLEAVARIRQFRFGADRSILDRADAAIRAHLGDAAWRRMAARTLAAIAAAEGPFDARQAACRRLVLLAGRDEAPALARALSDPRMAHYALMALDRIEDPAAPEAVRKALPRLQGDALIGAIDLLGSRRSAAATDELIRLLRAPHRDVSLRSARALAAIGGSKADGALLQQFRARDAGWRADAADALLDRADELRRAGRTSQAATLYGALGHPALPASVRAAAFRGRCLMSGERAIPTVVAALSASEPEIRRMAAVILRGMPGPTVTDALVKRLAELRGVEAIALVNILAERGDARAVSAIGRHIANPDRSIQVSVIRAIGILGGPEAVPLLLSAASGSDVEAAEAAAAALVALHGAEVDGLLAQRLDEPEPRRQAAAIRALIARDDDVPLDRIRTFVTPEAGEPRLAAIEALDRLGAPSDAAPLLDIVGTDPTGKALDAVVSIGRRDDSQTVAREIRRRIALPDTPDRPELTQALGEIGGSEGLAALTELASDADASVQLAAVRALSEWSEPSPMGLLLGLSRKPPSDRIRAVALRGYLRMMAMPGSGVRGSSAAKAFTDALELAKTPDEKRLVLAGMAGFGSERLLDLALSLREAPDLGAEAELAALEIARRTAGYWPDATTKALGALASGARDADTRARAGALSRIMQAFGDYLMGWEVSPAYAREGAMFDELFNRPFPPELSDRAGEVDWRPMPVGGAPDQPWLLDLLAVHGGEQKVAYLRTAVWTEDERDLFAEIGTDDGLKVWWNDALVLENNTQRAVAPGQEKVRLRSIRGWNRILIKVTQNIMGWGACVRLTQPDGSPVVGLRIGPVGWAE